MAKKPSISVNTVAKYVGQLEKHGLIYTEHTNVFTKDGQKRNGCLKYTIPHIQRAVDLCHERKLEKQEKGLALNTQREHTSKNDME